MTVSQDTVSGKWLEIKGEIQKAWGKLTADELEITKGDIKQIAGLVQQRYGEEQEKVQTKLSEIMKSFETKKEAVVNSIKQSIKQ